MRQGSNNGRRPRGRTNRKQHGGGGGGQSRTHTFDSNGPDGRVRGNARQVFEKYLSLARDATSAGDRIAAEAYFQHAEHYFRILSDTTDPTPTGRRHEDRPQPSFSNDEGYYGDDDDDAPVNGARDGQGESRQEGRHEGRQEGRHEGRQEGRHEGRQDGRNAGQRPPRREGEQRNAPEAAAPADSQPMPAPQAQPQPDVQAVEGEAPARPRRGRPRKPRQDDDGQPRQPEAASETESGPTVS